MPTISVIVPSYNKPHYLSECLHSIQSQVFTDWECIVVSDGSPHPDVVANVVEALRDSRFRLVIHKINKGLAAARNTGIQESAAELVLCADEDDVLHPMCLSTLKGVMDKSHSDIVCPQGKFFGGANHRREVYSPCLSDILWKQPVLPAGFLARKQVFTMVGFYDEHPIIRLGREDHEWWIRVVRNKLHIAICDQELYYIRRPYTRDLLHESLDYRATGKEVLIAKYIISKHSDLYRQYPKEARMFLRKAWRREAFYNENAGNYLKAIRCYYNTALSSRSLDDLMKAIKRTPNLLVKTITFSRSPRNPK